MKFKQFLKVIKKFWVLCFVRGSKAKFRNSFMVFRPVLSKCFNNIFIYMYINYIYEATNSNTLKKVIVKFGVES